METDNRSTSVSSGNYREERLTQGAFSTCREGVQDSVHGDGVPPPPAGAERHRPALRQGTPRSVMHGEETPRSRKTKPEVKQRVTAREMTQVELLLRKVPYGGTVRAQCV